MRHTRTIITVLVCFFFLYACESGEIHQPSPGIEVSSPIVSPAEASSSLDQAEIDWFNTKFFNNVEVSEQYIHNMFLCSTYDTAADINLFTLFYNGVDVRSSELTEEELKALAEYRGDDACMLDVFAVSASEMSEILLANLGIGLEETEKRGLENFIYLTEFDTYYNISGDTRYSTCTVISGQQNEAGDVVLQYELDGALREVTLKEIGGEYHFLSNRTSYT